ncbi:type II toxin-antitoxin system PemK/MazF family toxin [soil metagenome]
MLIIQSNPFNQSRITTAIVTAITSNLALAEAPGNVRLTKANAGLSRASVVNVSQVITIDRSLLSSRVKVLPGLIMRRIDEGLKLVLGR